MKTKNSLAVLCTVLPTLALAHPGADAGAHHVTAFFGGLAHPFVGFDHLAAMIAVGIWSALAFRESAKRMWAVPLAFATLLLIGGLLAFGGLNLGGVEPMIAASLLVLGIMVATQMKLPATIGAALVGALAIFHGVAHGHELSHQHAVQALAGMVLGTMTLHITGMLLGRFVLDRNVWLPRIAGVSVAVLGVSLLSSTI